MSQDELNKLKEEIKEEIISNLSISINSTSWGNLECRTHEVSVELCYNSIEISSSSVMLE